MPSMSISPELKVMSRLTCLTLDDVSLSWREYDGLTFLIETLQSWLEASEGKERNFLSEEIENPKDLLQRFIVKFEQLEVPPKPFVTSEPWQEAVEENRRVGNLRDVKEEIVKQLQLKEQRTGIKLRIKMPDP